MRKLILKLFKGIPVEEVDNLLNQEYKKHRIELDAQTSKTEMWQKKAVAYTIKLNNVSADIEKSSIPSNLKKSLIKKIKENKI